MSDFRIVENRFFHNWQPAPTFDPVPPEVIAFHRALPGYAPTPLVSLPALARSLGVGAVLVKDEASRFGLNAFKVLGASWAMFRLLQKVRRQKGLPELEPGDFLRAESGKSVGAMTFATATDGNHGRAVAWTARMLGQRAVIYVPGNTVRARIDALRGENAEVVVVDGTYDEAVERAAHDSEAHGWVVVSDTAWPGYLEIPGWIMEGYTTLFVEAEAQRRALELAAPTVVMLQAGVGGLAGAGARYFLSGPSGYSPRLLCVEPTDADCLLESAAHEDGEPHVARGRQQSIMAGLNCGVPSLLAWPLLRYSIPLFLAVADRYAEEAMRLLYRPLEGDPRVVAGESGAAGLAGLLALCREPELEPIRRRYGLTSEATVLLVNSEGATDPESFAHIVSEAGYPFK